MPQKETVYHSATEQSCFLVRRNRYADLNDLINEDLSLISDNVLYTICDEDACIRIDLHELFV